jgi:hypothetical protein
MRGMRPGTVFRIALAVLVLAGGIRAWWAARDRTPPTPPTFADSLETEGLREEAAAARELGERAAAADSLSRLALLERPGRDPFRSLRAAEPSGTPPAARPSPRPPGYAIPRVVRLAGEGPSKKIILSFGTGESRPLGAGDAERGWKILSIEASRVLVEQEGIIYTLPLP